MEQVSVLCGSEAPDSEEGKLPGGSCPVGLSPAPLGFLNLPSLAWVDHEVLLEATAWTKPNKHIQKQKGHLRHPSLSPGRAGL